MVDGFRNIGEGYGFRGSLPKLVQGYNTEAVITPLVL